MKAIIAGIMPVLNFIHGNPTLPPMGDLDVNPHLTNPFVERCKAALANFRTYMHSTAYATVGHALAVVRSLYPTVSLEVIDGGFA
jgi:5'-3' exonuclease